MDCRHHKIFQCYNTGQLRISLETPVLLKIGPFVSSNPRTVLDRKIQIFTQKDNFYLQDLLKNTFHTQVYDMSVSSLSSLFGPSSADNINYDDATFNTPNFLVDDTNTQNTQDALDAETDILVDPCLTAPKVTEHVNENTDTQPLTSRALGDHSQAQGDEDSIEALIAYRLPQETEGFNCQQYDTNNYDNVNGNENYDYQLDQTYNNFTEGYTNDFDELDAFLADQTQTETQAEQTYPAPTPEAPQMPCNDELFQNLVWNTRASNLPLTSYQTKTPEISPISNYVPIRAPPVRRQQQLPLPTQQYSAIPPTTDYPTVPTQMYNNAAAGSMTYPQLPLYPSPKVAQYPPPAYGSGLRHFYAQCILLGRIHEVPVEYLPAAAEAAQRMSRPQPNIAMAPQMPVPQMPVSQIPMPQNINLNASQAMAYSQPAMYKSGKITTSRLAKSTEQGNIDPKQVYNKFQPRPEAWGPLGSQGRPLFEYTPFGEWHAGRTFNASQMAHYISNCPRSLTMWVQSFPAQSKSRIGEEGDGTRDPYVYAGAMHLWCYEQCFDPVVDYEVGRLQGDDRVFPHELKNAMALNRDTDKEIMRDAFHPWFTMQDKSMPRMTPRLHNETLACALVEYHLEKQPTTRQVTREKRNAKHKGENYKTNDIHKGDLLFLCERTPAYKAHVKSRGRITSRDENSFQLRFSEGTGDAMGAGLGVLGMDFGDSWAQTAVTPAADPDMDAPQGRKRGHDEVEGAGTDASGSSNKFRHVDEFGSPRRIARPRRG
ncbi:hypothetical protein N3K66_001820 [Trichothecium roseum]|uniref:Uncharacterized protein n=1 Tax=Trichothecium roseum TaxID=47278 RepID=A0ACC0VAI1_9HYPO|nr:hypothetical protein N3K66_001820 [Trichothecium roseum]